MKHRPTTLVTFLVSLGLAGPAFALTSDQIAAIHSKIAASKIRPSARGKQAVAQPARPIETAIISARNLIGRAYDQTMGNDGGKNYAAGQIVCVDVPRLAFLDAGIPIGEVLREDARLNPGRYPKERSGDNLPDHPIFARRTRNWLRWCQGNGRLLPATATPKPGDVIFYGDIHISFVTAVESDGHYRVVECAPSTGRALEQYEWMVGLRGWNPTGIGRIYPLPASYAALAKTPRVLVAKAVDPKYTIENQQKQHPGLAMMTGVLNRLRGGTAPIRIAALPNSTNRPMKVGPSSIIIVPLAGEQGLKQGVIPDRRKAVVAAKPAVAGIVKSATQAAAKASGRQVVSKAVSSSVKTANARKAGSKTAAVKGPARKPASTAKSVATRRPPVQVAGKKQGNKPGNKPGKGPVPSGKLAGQKAAIDAEVPTAGKNPAKVPVVAGGLKTAVEVKRGAGKATPGGKSNPGRSKKKAPKAARKENAKRPAAGTVSDAD